VCVSLSAPNILFLLPDQWRFDWLSTTPGLPVRTPNLQALAERGVRFTRAVCPSPLCAPSRACLAAGKEYDRCRVPSNGVDYPLDQTTYYTLLRDAAQYHVAGVGKFDLHKASYIWGLDGKHLLQEWGFSDGIDSAGKIDAVRSGKDEPKDPYMAYLYRRGLAAAHIADLNGRRGFAATYPTPLPADAYSDNWLSNNGVELLRQFPKDRPWHLQVNFTGPHNPMDITQEMTRLYEGVQFPGPHAATEGLGTGQGYEPEAHNRVRQNYSAMVENIDRWVGTFLAEVERRGELDRTLVVFSSDHGEMLGDHGLWGKTQPYQPSVGIPMIVAGPGVAQGVVSDALVSLMDLAATYLDYAGIPRPTDMDSLSLRPLLEGRANAHRQVVRSGLGPWRVMMSEHYKLVTGYKRRGQEGEAPTLLFDMLQDPWETENLAAQLPDVVEELSKA
jgi:arylsulfatase